MKYKPLNRRERQAAVHKWSRTGACGYRVWWLSLSIDLGGVTKKLTRDLPSAGPAHSIPGLYFLVTPPWCLDTDMSYFCPLGQALLVPRGGGFSWSRVRCGGHGIMAYRICVKRATKECGDAIFMVSTGSLRTRDPTPD